MHTALSYLLAEKSRTELDFLLEVFLTPKEQAVLRERVALMQMLLSETYTHREIAAQQSISIAKVTRGANLLKRCTRAQHDRLRALLGKLTSM